MDSLSSFDLTVKEAQNRLRSGSLSVEDLCSKINVRMKKTKGLNIHVTTASDEYLLEQSKQSQRRIDKGTARPLEGIPIGFKDNFCSKDMPTTCCSSSLSGFVPSYNSTLIQRCLDNGALLTGKLNMDEFALGGCNLNSFFGPCVNPWTVSTLSTHKQNTQSPETSGLTDKDFYVSGGSSGGSGAAVAAGTCLAAFGSDTGGSVRIPASYCGVVGLKPTYGLLSRHGVIPFANSLDCPGILTKTVEDCAIILNAVSGPDCEDSTTIHSQSVNIHLDSDLDMKELHIGIPKEYHVPGMSQEVVALWREMGDLLEKAGAKVSTVSLPKTKEARECYNVISCCELADTFTRFDKETLGLVRGNTESVLENSYGKCQPDLGKEVQQRVQQGLGYLKESNSETEKHYMKAKQIRRQICDEFKDLFDDGVDMLLTPTTISEAPLKSWCLLPENQELLSTMDPLLETANLAGLPAISIPLRLSRNGLPLSLQLIGQAFGESNLLSVAHWLEQAANCTYLSPNV